MQVHRILFEAANGYTNTLLLKVPVGINFFENTYKLKMQLEMNFLKTPATSKGFLNFLLRQQGSWIAVRETQPSSTKCRSSKIEVKLQCGFMLGQPFPTKCVSILKNCKDIALFAFRWFCVALFAQNASWSPKLRWNYGFLRLDGFA